MYEDIKTACLYVRFSSHNQTEQSIEGQTRVCRDFCKRHNIRIVEIYADRATSASKDIEKRVQFLKMIKDSEKGLFDAVIVYKLDRFARSRYDSATYKYRLKRNGVQLISATENISNDPEGIILESVLEGMAEFYSAELSQKINRGMRESAYKHNSIGGAVPLGYKIEDKKLVIDPKTAPIVKEAFEKYADGETVAEICRQFNARGYKTSKGTAFGKSSFTKIFRNERYIGVYTFHDYRAEDAIPAIIEKDLWDRVQLRVGKIKNAPARNKAKVVYLLSGKIFCGHCGSKMNGNCNAGNYYYYQCYGKKNGNVDCKKKNIRKEFIERLVAQDALSLLTDEYIEQIATIACEKNQHEIELDSALPTIRDRIHQVDLSLNNLLKAIESGSAPDMLVKRMGELEKEKKDLQAQAKKESEDIVELDKAQVIYWLEQFRGGSIEDEEFCRMLIDLFVNSVTVWDEDDNTYKVTVAYNLTSLPTKTYRLSKGGTLSDFTSNAPGIIDDSVFFAPHSFPFLLSVHQNFFPHVAQVGVYLHHVAAGVVHLEQTPRVKVRVPQDAGLPIVGTAAEPVVQLVDAAGLQTDHGRTHGAVRRAAAQQELRISRLQKQGVRLLLQQRKTQLLAVEFPRRGEVVLVEHTGEGTGEHVRFVHVAAAGGTVALQQVDQIAAAVPQRHLPGVAGEDVDVRHLLQNALHAQGEVDALGQEFAAALTGRKGDLGDLQTAAAHVEAVALPVRHDRPVVVGLEAQHLAVEKDAAVVILQVQDVATFVKCDVHAFGPFVGAAAAAFRRIRGAESGWG